MAPAIEAIVAGRTDLVFDYVGDGHPATATDSEGVSLLQWCAYYGDVSAMKFLLSHGAELTSLGENLDLNGAAFHGHWGLCQFLIERGAEVNHALPATGERPLHAALSQTSRPVHNLVVSVLLAHHADANCHTLESAETGSFMRDCRTKGETPLHRAAAFGDEESIQMLLDAGASVEGRDMYGDTPLTWASWHLRPAYILALLCHGPHRVHPEAVSRSRIAEPSGRATMEINLLGRPLHNSHRS